MSLRSNETVIRMGPITIIALLIVIALATLGVLSLVTAQAANTAATKQDAAIKALYENEVAAQQFLSQLDEALEPARASKLSAQDAVASLSQSGQFEGISIDGITLQHSFESGTRVLSVIVVVRDDLNYQVVSWKTSSTLDTEEEVELWQGNATEETAVAS